jgi:hypothetical protein
MREGDNPSFCDEFIKFTFFFGPKISKFVLDKR